MFLSMDNELVAEASLHEWEDRTVPAVLRQAAYRRAVAGGPTAAPAYWRTLSRRLGTGLIRGGQWLEGIGAAQTAAAASTDYRASALKTG